MRLIAFGDIHMNLGRFKDIPGIEMADYVIITGDITNFGNRRDAENIIREIAAINQNVLAVAGNLDHPDVEEYLAEMQISLHGRGIKLGGIGVVGLGGSNHTPFNTPNEFSEKELAALLDAGSRDMEDAPCRLLVSHCPPAQTKTDLIHGGVHVGSNAVRAFIEEHQPQICITGHIHEACAEDHIGRTQVLNPGMIGSGGWVEIIMKKNIAEGTIRFT